MEVEDAVRKIMLLEIKPNPVIAPEAYGEIARVLTYIYGVGFDAGFQEKEDCMSSRLSTHPIGLITASGAVLRSFPSVKKAMQYTKDSKNTILQAIKLNRKTKRGYRYMYLTEGKVMGENHTRKSVHG